MKLTKVIPSLSFIDKTKKGNYIKFHSLFFEGTSAKSDDVVYTEGLTVNGKEIASPLVAAFIRTPLAWLGGAGTICFCILVVSVYH